MNFITHITEMRKNYQNINIIDFCIEINTIANNKINSLSPLSSLPSLEELYVDYGVTDIEQQFDINCFAKLTIKQKGLLCKKRHNKDLISEHRIRQ